MGFMPSKIWTQQPQVAVEIDWSNPLARTITNCLPLNGDNRDIVTGKKITVVNGTTGTDARGKSLRSSGANSCASVPLDLSAHTKLTISFWLYWNAFANDDDFAIELSSNTNTTDGGFNVDPNASTGNFQAYNRITSTGNGQAYEVTRPTAAAWHHYMIVFDRTQTGATKIYVDGEVGAGGAYVSGIYDNAGATPFANSTLYLFSRANSSLFGAGRMQNLTFRGGYIGTAADAKAEFQNPWQIFKPLPSRIFPAVAGGGVSGTLAITESVETVSAAATVALSASLSATESAETLTASGQLALNASLSATETAETLTASGVVGSGVTGTLSVTESDETATASGSVAVSAVSNLSESPETLFASVVVALSGSLAQTDAAETATATGSVTLTGVLSANESAETLTANGVVASGPVCTLNITEVAETASAAGSVAASGSAAITEAAESATASAVIQIVGTVNLIELAETLTASGIVLSGVTGFASLAEAAETLSASGSITSGSLSGSISDADINRIVAAVLAALNSTTIPVNAVMGWPSPSDIADAVWNKQLP